MRSLLCYFLLLPLSLLAQEISYDFEGNTMLPTWEGDNCDIDTRYVNPYSDMSNPSATVMQYADVGGQYANVRVQLEDNLDLRAASAFKVMIYVPSSSVVGEQPQQLSLKLQDGRQAEPWLTQTEIIKPIVYDQWQQLTFDFARDNFINLDGGSAHPLMREDFNRILLQVNGENNNATVVAYIDDISLSPSSTTTGAAYDQLVWSDEFDTDGPIDATKWFHQTELPSGGSWFNGEIQHYTDRTENAEVKDGVLHITARKERFTDQGQTKDYTSARLNSKFAFTYGKIDIRARLPRGVGTWPAIWMLGRNITEDGAYWQQQGFGTTGWPDCGEIDIMEHWGDNQNFVQSAIHTRSSFGNTTNKGGFVLPTASDDFHTYSLTWTPDSLIFSVDEIVFYTYAPDVSDRRQWPFFEPQYLLLNVAIQPIIDPSITEAALEIDYVRVYQQGSVTDVTDVFEDLEPRVYPNPVTDSFFIEVGIVSAEESKISIYTHGGQLVKSVAVPMIDGRMHITPVDDLVPGVYIVHYTVGDRSDSIKFVKQ